MVKITLLIPDMKDKNNENCIKELIIQANASISNLQKQIDDLRSEINGKQ